jgi:PhnB protein
MDGTEGAPLGLTPILVVSDALAAINFYGEAFGAVEIARISAPDSRRLIHVRMRLFGSILVFMDEMPEMAGKGSRFHTPDKLNGTSVSLHLQVADAEELWQLAVGAGATSVVALAKQFWGELYGRLIDPFGHEWTIAQLIEQVGDADVAAATAFRKAP